MTNFRVVCVFERDMKEYVILEDVSLCTLDEACAFMKENHKKYSNYEDGIRWLLFPL